VNTFSAGLFLLVAVWSSAAFSQIPSPFVDPVPPATVAAPVGIPREAGLMGKVLGIVGRSEPGPLTEKDRFHQYLMSVGGPMPLFSQALSAAMSQETNSPPEWGQGWSAFGERYGSNLAKNGVRRTITYGVSTAFREDNRYFASGKHGFWGRTSYAMISPFTARHSDGRTSFSVSTVSGVIGASAIATIWEPGSRKGIHHMADSAGISFSTAALLNIVKEFLPDRSDRR
jgi:hypothetical protein